MRGSTIFEQILLDYRIILAVRVVSGTASHHRHDRLKLSRTRITGRKIAVKIASVKSLVRSRLLLKLSE